MFYIIFFFISLYASFEKNLFEKNLAIVTQKPWLTSHLIKESDLLNELKREDKDLEKIIDYKVFAGKLWYIARTKGGIDDCGCIGQQSVSICSGNQVNGPLLLNAGKYLLNGKIFDINAHNSLILDNSLYGLKNAIQLRNWIYLIDECGYLLRVYLDPRKNSPYKACFLCIKIDKKNDQLIQPRFVAFSKSEDSVFLETNNGEIVEIVEIEKDTESDLRCERIFRNQKQLEQEIKTKKCEEKPLNFGYFEAKDYYLPISYEIFDAIRYYYLKFWLRPRWQSFVWITLCSTSLCLNKSSFKSELFLLFATAGALLVSNRKFLLNYMNDVLHKPRV